MLDLGVEINSIDDICQKTLNAVNARQSTALSCSQSRLLSTLYFDVEDVLVMLACVFDVPTAYGSESDDIPMIDRSGLEGIPNHHVIILNAFQISMNPLCQILGSERVQDMLNAWRKWRRKQLHGKPGRRIEARETGLKILQKVPLLVELFKVATELAGRIARNGEQVIQGDGWVQYGIPKPVQAVEQILLERRRRLAMRKAQRKRIAWKESSDESSD